MTTDPGSLLPVAMQAVVMAREIILTRHPTSVTEKSDRDLVSDIDLAVERVVRDHLRKATPDAGFLGEEEGRSGDPDTTWLWTLDPIDGTSNFTHGIPLCATSLALLRDGRPVLAVIDAPLLNECYHAIEGHGTYIGTRRLKASTITHLRDAVVAIGDYAVGEGADHKNELRLAATIQLTPRVHRIRMLGTAALDLAWVAAGRLDASITLQNTPWDVCAGVLIAREAGASVVDADGSPHDLASAATIAAPAQLISQLIPLIPLTRAADLVSTDETSPGRTSPYAALDGILSRARSLIFEFDGPICDLSAAMPVDTADQLAASLGAQATVLTPGQTAAPTPDPAEIIARVAAANPDLARQMNSQLTDIEARAVTKARPAAYGHETLAACRDSGRAAAIISHHSASAVSTYLTSHQLTDQVRAVIAPDAYPPGHLQTTKHLIEDALHALGTTAADSALITTSTTGIDTAHSTGIQSVGYAMTPADAESLAAAGAGCVIPSLADVTLRLRARPLMPLCRDLDGDGDEDEGVDDQGV
jgi:myo-inositol-1(or 4)-monophosphatase